jgi:hypothetical protein
MDTAKKAKADRNKKADSSIGKVGFKNYIGLFGHSTL